MTKFTTRLRRAGVLLVSSALLLTACATGGSTAPKSGSASDGLTIGEVPAEKTKLTVWSFLPGNYDKGKEAYQEIIAGFNKKYPQVTVEMVEMPYPTYFDQVRNATVSRSGPDVITMYGGAQAYSYRNGLYPLQNAIDPKLRDDLRFVDQSYSKDGNLYIMPTGAYGYTVMVNQDKLTQAGLDPKTALASWDSMLATCKALTEKGIQPFASGWKDGFLLETLMYMISSQLMDAATLKKWTAGELPITDPIFKQTIDYVLGMDKAGCFGDKSALERTMWDDSFNQYFANQTAMLVTGSLNTGERAAAAVPNTTTVALPQVPGSKYKSLVDAGAEAGWSVTKWTKSPQAALAFVNYLAGPEAQQIMWDKAQLAPNLKSMKIEPTTPIQKAYLPLINNSENHTGFASYPLTVLAVVERNAAPLIGGTMSVEEFFTQANQAFEQSK